MILIQPPVVQNWNSLVNKPSILSDNQISWNEIQNKPTTLTGYGITNGQPLGNELTALQSLADTPGFLKKTGDGTYSIDINSYLSLAGGTLTGALIATSFSGSLTGNASTATTLQTARTIALSGAATGTATGFNGSANITIPVTALNASNLTTGTINAARLPASYLPLTGGTITGDLISTSATPSTSPTTGASIIPGGQGIGGNQYVGGFSSLGGDASHPGIKIKVLTGTTAATEGDTASVAHDINSTKIIAISVFVNHVANRGLGNSYTFAPGYQFDFAFSSTGIVIYNHPTNSELILSKPFTVTLIYKE
jgi:hypothetical protein